MAMDQAVEGHRHLLRASLAGSYRLLNSYPVLCLISFEIPISVLKFTSHVILIYNIGFITTLCLR